MEKQSIYEIPYYFNSNCQKKVQGEPFKWAALTKAILK